MGKKILIPLFFLGIFFIFSVILLVVSFENVKDRYREIVPNLDNYSTSEVLLLSFEQMRTALLKSDGVDLHEFDIRKDVFFSRLSLLREKSPYSSAFSYDKDFIHIKEELSRNEDILASLSKDLRNGRATKGDVERFMSVMDSTLLDLQEVIYKIQISNFNEVKYIIQDNTGKAELSSFVSLMLLFLIILIIVKNSRSLKELIKKKNIFISAIYHELASSTQSIVIAADIIENELVGENLKKEVGIISYHASKILDQTREVMDYSRLEVGGVKVNLSEVNVKDLIIEAVSEVNSVNNNRFKIVTTPNKLAIRSDRYKLYRIIVNLLDNANKNTFDGLIIINVKVVGSSLFILVKDNGVGFNMLIINDLFKAFNQGAEKKTKQGLGLGLTIIKNYVASLKGKIRVKSVEGAGSTFVICIPVDLIKK